METVTIKPGALVWYETVNWYSSGRVGFPFMRGGRLLAHVGDGFVAVHVEDMRPYDSYPEALFNEAIELVNTNNHTTRRYHEVRAQLMAAYDAAPRVVIDTTDIEGDDDEH